jgi:hypothetical protein
MNKILILQETKKKQFVCRSMENVEFLFLMVNKLDLLSPECDCFVLFELGHVYNKKNLSFLFAYVSFSS